MKRITRYDLTPDQEHAVMAYLSGEMRLSDLTTALGYEARAPQSAINAVTGICRQWVMEGKLKF